MHVKKLLILHELKGWITLWMHSLFNGTSIFLFLLLEKLFSVDKRITLEKLKEILQNDVQCSPEFFRVSCLVIEIPSCEANTVKPCSLKLQ